MKLFKAKLDIPLYYTSITLVVDNTAHGCCRRAKPGFNIDPGEWSAVTATEGGHVAILLPVPTISYGIIAHEVFHATHVIMEDHCEPMDPKHHEPYAYLNGYITGWVYKELKKRGARIR